MFELLNPRMKVKSIYDIDLRQLRAAGIRGLIADLDNTLVGAKEPQATPELVEWLNEAASHGIQIVIVSNNTKERVDAFASPLALPFIPRARKPLPKSFRKAMRMMNLSREEMAVVGDQMLTDVLGGNRLGLYTILVQPISPPDEGFFTKINRKIEKFVLARRSSKERHDQSHR